MFTWDKSRYPNPKKFLFKLKDLGIHLVANVKPALLDDHPLYEEAKLKNITRSKYILLTNSGTAALFISLKQLNIENNA